MSAKKFIKYIQNFYVILLNRHIMKFGLMRNSDLSKKVFFHNGKMKTKWEGQFFSKKI